MLTMVTLATAAAALRAAWDKIRQYAALTVLAENIIVGCIVNPDMLVPS